MPDDVKPVRVIIVEDHASGCTPVAIGVITACVVFLTMALWTGEPRLKGLHPPSAPTAAEVRTP